MIYYRIFWFLQFLLSLVQSEKKAAKPIKAIQIWVLLNN